MAIKTLITLEGVEAIQGQLSALTRNGEAFMKTLSDFGGSVKPFQELADGVGKSGKGMSEAIKPATELRDVLYVLRPIANELGVRMGALGNLSRLAGVGLAGIVVAGAGAAAIAMARLSEGADDAKRQLEGLFQSRQAGQNAFAQMQSDAKNLGTTFTTLLPVAQKMQLALEKWIGTGGKFVAPSTGVMPAIGTGFADTTKSSDSLIASLKLGSSTLEQARAAASKFTDQLYNSGKVTGDMIRELQLAGIDTSKFVSILNQGNTRTADFAKTLDLLPMPIRRFLDLMTIGTPQISKWISAEDIEKPKTFSDSWSGMVASIQRTLTGTNGIGTMLSIFMQGITKIINAVDIMTSSETWVKAWGNLTKDAKAAWDFIAQTFSVNPFTLESWTATFDNLWNDLKSKALAAWNYIKYIWGTNPASGFSGLPSRGGMELNYAGGGLIRGPGTSTSDSILAWLSDQEFVVNARAVNHYGSDFFAALNAMRLPKDIFGGFNMGGLVDALARSMPMPHLAGGGMATAGTPITLNIGGQSFGMTASEDTVRKLRSYAVQNQLSSTGRKPRWVR